MRSYFASWPQRLAITWLLALLLVTALAPILPLPYPPDLPDLAHVSQPPFSPGQHWLGTDPQGRDVLSNLLFGARTAVVLTLPASLLAALLGIIAGGAAGYWGNGLRLAWPAFVAVAGLVWWALRLPLPGLGMVVAGAAGLALLPRRPRWQTWPVPLDAVVMGAASTLDTIPRLILVLALAAGSSLSVPGLLLLLALTSWPTAARLVRAQMLRVRALPFIEAARAAGLPAGRVWWRHALPQVLWPLRPALALSLAGLLALENTLSFLGIGLSPEVASWGRLLATARQDPSAWWTFAFPCLLLITTIISISNVARIPHGKQKPMTASETLV